METMTKEGYVEASNNRRLEDWTWMIWRMVHVRQLINLMVSENQTGWGNTSKRRKPRQNPFGFLEMKSWMQTLPNRLTMILGSLTDVQPFSGCGFPTHHSNLAAYNELAARADNDAILTDVRVVGNINPKYGGMAAYNATEPGVSHIIPSHIYVTHNNLLSPAHYEGLFNFTMLL